MKKHQDAFNYAERIIAAILEKISGLNKSRKKFLLHIFILYMGMRGRYNFTNMSRWGNYSEKSYRNNFSDGFDWLPFNVALVQSHCSKHLVIAFDPSYIPKSGRHTEHLGYFWSGTSGKALKGLEIGGLAAIDVENNTALSLEAIQTPNSTALNAQGKTLTDHYAEIIIHRAKPLRELSRYVVVDGYFAKEKFIGLITEKTDLEVISKLRDDANLQYLYEGPQEKRRGAPKKFDGKVNIKKVDKKRFKLCYKDEETLGYEAICWSPVFQRKIKVVYLEHWKKEKFTGQYAILFSTDIHLAGELIYRYYKSRYQIEFLFRDAKQFCGLTHCQARDEAKMRFHFNASLTTVSLAKTAHFLSVKGEKPVPFSMQDIKTVYANKIIAERIFSNLELELSCEKIKPLYWDILSMGSKTRWFCHSKAA